MNEHNVEMININLDQLLEGISVGINSPECTHGLIEKLDTTVEEN